MGVAAIFQLPTPYTAEELFDIQYEQAADVMVFTHLNHRQRQLVRFGHDRWAFEPIVVGTKSWPPGGVAAQANAPNQGTGYQASEQRYVVTTIDAASGQESLPSVEVTAQNDLTLKGNSNTISWTAKAGAERYNIYKKGGGAWGYIGTTEGVSFADEFIAPDFSQSFPRHKNPFEGEGDYPGSVAFWQQRAFYGRTLNKPNAIFASQAANLFNFNASSPIIDSDAATFAVAARRVNAILHLVPLKNLIAFTTDAVFSIGKDFAPTSIDINPEGYRAASKVRPVVIDDVIMFNTAKGGSIRTLGYEFQADGYRGNDLTVYAPHLFRNITMKDMAWGEYPFSVLHCVGSDGDVRALTWQREQDIWGWSLISTRGVIESTCTVTENGEDRTYFVVKRQLPGLGGEARTVEYLTTSLWTDIKDAVYLDCARTYRGPPATVIKGLFYLEDQWVTVLADGAAKVDHYQVKGGKITLDRPASVVHVGLSYESWIRTVPPNFEARDGTTKGKAKTISGFAISVLRSRGIEAGQGKDMPPGLYPDTGHVNWMTSDPEIAGEAYELKTRNNEPMGQVTALYTGDLWAPLEAGDWKDASVVIRQRYPLPMHVINIIPDVVVGGAQT